MRATLLVLLLALATAAAGAAELRLAEHDPLARPGTLFAFTVERDPGPADEAGERILSVVLSHDGVAVADARIRLTTPHQLDRGVRAFVPIPADLTARSLHCALQLEGGPGDPATAEAEIPTWVGLMARLARTAKAIAGTDDPQPRLWLEQAQLAAIHGGDLATAGRIAAGCDRIETWLDGARDHGPRPGERIELALRCPVDGSVQPLRISLPEGRVRAVVSCLVEHETSRKDAWPALPETWYQGAAERGLALVEWYPAGDRRWSGIAATRHEGLRDQVLERYGLDRLPLLVLGRGTGALAALRSANRDPTRYAALAVVAPASPAERANHHLPPTLSAWFDGRRGILGLGAGLGGLAVAGVGELPATWRAVLQREAGGGSAIAEASLWQWLATAAALPRAGITAGRWRVTRPGRYGPVAVTALERWGREAAVTLDRSGLQADGVAAWRWLGTGDPPAVSAPAPALDAAPPAATAKVLDRACGPIDAFAEGPFAVVVGRSGDVASNERNRVLGQAFLDHWVAHAQGAPRWCHDDEFDPQRFAGHHLVCVGGPDSNRVAATATLPLRWDVRGLNVGGQRYRSGEHLAVALCLPRGDDPARLLVVLAGAAGWNRDPALPPLRDWPDLGVLPLAGYHDLDGVPPALWAFADNAWRFTPIEGDD